MTFGASTATFHWKRVGNTAVFPLLHAKLTFWREMIFIGLEASIRQFFSKDAAVRNSIQSLPSCPSQINRIRNNMTRAIKQNLLTLTWLAC